MATMDFSGYPKKAVCDRCDTREQFTRTEFISATGLAKEAGWQISAKACLCPKCAAEQKALEPVENHKVDQLPAEISPNRQNCGCLSMACHEQDFAWLMITGHHPSCSVWKDDIQWSIWDLVNKETFANNLRLQAYEICKRLGWITKEQADGLEYQKNCRIAELDGELHLLKKKDQELRSAALGIIDNFYIFTNPDQTSAMLALMQALGWKETAGGFQDPREYLPKPAAICNDCHQPIIHGTARVSGVEPAGSDNWYHLHQSCDEKRKAASGQPAIEMAEDPTEINHDVCQHCDGTGIDESMQWCTKCRASGHPQNTIWQTPEPAHLVQLPDLAQAVTALAQHLETDPDLRQAWINIMANMHSDQISRAHGLAKTRHDLSRAGAEDFLTALCSVAKDAHDHGETHPLITKHYKSL